MKAFMKGFTSHGLNWGPEFASATHVLSRRRVPLPPPPHPAPRNPAGPYSHPPPLFIFPSSRGLATSRVFSIDPRKCLVFHHHHIRRRYLASRPRRSRPSLSFLLFLSFRSSRSSRIYFTTGHFHGCDFSRHRRIKVRLTRFARALECRCHLHEKTSDEATAAGIFAFPGQFSRRLEGIFFHRKYVRTNYCRNPRRVDVRFRVNWTTPQLFCSPIKF